MHHQPLVWLAALLLAVAMAAPPALEQVEEASPRYIQSASVVQDTDNSVKQVYYEAAAPGATDLQHQEGVTQDEQHGTEVAAGAEPTHPPVSLTGIMTSVWDLMVSWVRGILGLQRHDPPRMARAILGAAAGDEQCWRTTACQAGRLLRGLHEKEFIFMMMERLSPMQWKGVVKGMRRAALENEDCRKYECDA